MHGLCSSDSPEIERGLGGVPSNEAEVLNRDSLELQFHSPSYKEDTTKQDYNIIADHGIYHREEYR